MQNSFLLTNALSERLYHECAKTLPIIDYHNHLAVSDIVENRRFENIAQLWVIADPYKHRAMRILGIPEKFITGDATDFEKFEVWYNALPKLIGNPLFDWSQMELKTVFDIDLLPFNDASVMWEKLNTKLSEMASLDILRKFNIEYSAPCTALTDDLSIFNKESGLCPSLRGDDLILPKCELLSLLSELSKKKISTLSDYIDAIDARLSAFKEVGTFFTDHALDNGFAYIADDGKNEERFEMLLAGELSKKDELPLRSCILKSLMSLYSKHGFTVQLHIGAQRTTSTRLRTLAGAAGGYAAIGHTVDVCSITSLLDDVEKTPTGLPRILLFTLNPSDNAVFATLSGSYSKDNCESLVSQGPAWWWCDHYEGIYNMLSTFMTHSVLSTFTGMTTDSRSLLSFVRHDYFRRVLCEWISDMVNKKRLPNDFSLLSATIRKICYENAKKIIGG